MTDDLDNIWVGGEADDLADVPAGAVKPAKRDAFFGAPLWWIKRVAPLARGKSELLVAILLWRLRIVNKSRTVVLTNTRLLTDLGVGRSAKYRMLQQLEAAGLVRVARRGKASPRVTFVR